MSDSGVAIERHIRALAREEFPEAGEIPVWRERIERYLLSLPIESALSLASPANGYSTPVEGLDYTLEEGLLVFSAWYHLRRGYCCGNGCRHCPYPPSHKN